MRRVMVTLGSILAHAQMRKQWATLPCVISGGSVVGARLIREAGKGEAGGREAHPSPAEVAAILAHAKGRWRPLLVTAALLA